PIRFTPLALHDALPIWGLPRKEVQEAPRVRQTGKSRVTQSAGQPLAVDAPFYAFYTFPSGQAGSLVCPRFWGSPGAASSPERDQDRKSTRLNSSHVKIS